ncbi:MAG TPA: hypothetical protein RMH99_16300 [Sandaracinaceae bacterium LLY-WYZ-13_1]|nr:hypothetical protein [Sandaracinaceae bacterium LLY-WYZ-13_1]
MSRRFVPGRRARWALVGAGAPFALVAFVLIDAARLTAARAGRSASVARVTETPDLALSSSARWLRHPSQSEAGAAFSDLPASLDVDPAGALLGPPREVLEAGAPEAVEIRSAR